MRDGQAFGHKNVVEEPEVTKAIIKYRKTVWRFDDAYMALTDTLARGQGIKGECWKMGNVIYYLYTQRRDELAKTPRLSAVYTCSEREITLIALRVIPYK